MHRSICDFVLDLIHNSIEAGSELIVLDFHESATTVEIFVADNGPGMSADKLQRVKDPFFTDGTKHVHREVGLGLAFLSQAVEMAGGEFEIDSREDQGTSVKVCFDLENIDTPPIGDLSHSLLAAMTYPGLFELVVNRSSITNASSYSLKRSELEEAVGGFDTGAGLKLLRDYLRVQEGMNVQENMQLQERIGEETAVGRMN